MSRKTAEGARQLLSDLQGPGLGLSAAVRSRPDYRRTSPAYPVDAETHQG